MACDQETSFVFVQQVGISPTNLYKGKRFSAWLMHPRVSVNGIEATCFYVKGKWLIGPQHTTVEQLMDTIGPFDSSEEAYEHLLSIKDSQYIKTVLASKEARSRDRPFQLFVDNQFGTINDIRCCIILMDGIWYICPEDEEDEHLMEDIVFDHVTDAIVYLQLRKEN